MNKYLEKISSMKGGAILGGVVGAYSGLLGGAAISAIKKEDKLEGNRRVALGAIGGAITGAAGGAFGPPAYRSVKNLVNKAVSYPARAKQSKETTNKLLDHLKNKAKTITTRTYKDNYKKHGFK